jgi:hypothetical protein
MAYGYTPNPGYPSNTAAAACPVTTPQKVCGVISPPGPDDLEHLQWVEIDYVNGPGTAQSFTSTTTYARRALVDAPLTNTADVTMGPNSTATLVTMPSGNLGYLIEMPGGTAFNLANWYAKSASPGQKLNILYLPA